MRVATSRYFAKAAIEASGLIPIGFTRGWPKFGVSVDVVANLRALGPVGDMFGIEDRDEFAKRYKAHLDAIGVDHVHAALLGAARLVGNEGVVLLCFCDLEKPGVWCHRQVFAEWWEEQTGEKVDELDVPEIPAEERLVASQASLEMS